MGDVWYGGVIFPGKAQCLGRGIIRRDYISARSITLDTVAVTYTAPLRCGQFPKKASFRSSLLGISENILRGIGLLFFDGADAGRRCYE